MKAHSGTEEDAAVGAAHVLRAAGQQDGERWLATLPLTQGDASLVQMALGTERRDTRAMMLGHAASALAERGDAAAGVGIARALEAFWCDEGQTDERYRPLARVEVGSALITQARGCLRLGEVRRITALCDARPGLHDRQRYLRITAAEALVRKQRFDEARALFPPERPMDDVAEQTAWDVVHRLLEPFDPADPGDDGAAGGGGTIQERWKAAIEGVSQVVQQTGKAAGLPQFITDMMLSRLSDERAKVPQTEAELVKRIDGLRRAMMRQQGD